MNKEKNITVRMAPSPTGALHVGTARAALFNYLFAKRYGGKFIMRVEDTDKERSLKKWEDQIIEGLLWLGIEWDKPSKNTLIGQDEDAIEKKIVRQSDRIKAKVYRKYLEKMLEEGSAFYCWHTKDELQKERQEQQEAKEAPRHYCQFRNQKITDKDKIKMSIIRFKNDSEDLVTFNDAVRGEVSFEGKNLGDFSIAKNTDMPLYNFAVVVDDYEMDVTHVIRGEDHISNTPRQILIQKALGLPTPVFVHLPLILGTDKSKLSKRHGATSVQEYKSLGYLPYAMFNFLALLGWRAKDDEKEIMARDEIIEEFDVEKIQQAGAVFDIEKLNWMNGSYIRKLSLDELAQMCIPFLKDAGLITSREEKNIEWLKKVVAMEHERIKKLSDIAEATEFVFKDIDYDASLLVWKNMELADLSETLLNLHDIIKSIPEENWNKEDIEKTIMPQAEMTGNRGAMLWPLRVALTGRKASPGPFEILEVLGKDLSLKRVKKAHDKIKNIAN